MSGSRWLPLLVLCASPSVFAHDIITTKLTYARDVQPILAHRCLACHAASAAIPLTTYEQVRPWAVDIKEQVLSRAMPPWGAVKGFRALDPDESLTEDELTIVAAWVVGGTPEGNSAPSAKPPLVPVPGATTPVTEIHIDTRRKLDATAQVIGIQPLATGVIGAAKITARLPDGRIEPLLWLAQYDGASKRAFHFREPVLLPIGTVIASTTPLRFALQAVKASPPVR